MPTLHVRLSPPPSPDRHALLAQALTTLTAQVLGKRAEVTAVLIDVLPTQAWFIGAAPAAQPTALLEIDITQGTNTTEEKAVFIEAAFKTLQDHLAPGASLAPASYVIVRELPATDWGYGGVTPQARHRASQACADHA